MFHKSSHVFFHIPFFLYISRIRILFFRRIPMFHCKPIFVLSYERHAFAFLRKQEKTTRKQQTTLRPQRYVRKTTFNSILHNNPKQQKPHFSPTPPKTHTPTPTEPINPQHKPHTNKHQQHPTPTKTSPHPQPNHNTPPTPTPPTTPNKRAALASHIHPACQIPLGLV